MGGYHWLLSRGRVLEPDPDTGAARVLAGTHVDRAGGVEEEGGVSLEHDGCPSLM